MFLHTIPGHINTQETAETDKSVAHKSDTTTLGSSTEECNFSLLLSELVGIELHSTPCGAGAGVLVVLEVGEMNTETSVCLDNTAVADLQMRNERRTKVTEANIVSCHPPTRTFDFLLNLQNTLAGHGICLLINALDVPEVLLLGFVVGSEHNRYNIEVKPKAGAQRRTHVLEGDGETSSNELDKVLMLISLNLVDDVISNEILALTHILVEGDMLDGEIIEIDGVVDSKCNHGGMVIGENGRDSKVQSLRLSYVSRFMC